MPSCIHCGANTEMFEFDEPICVPCAENTATPPLSHRPAWDSPALPNLPGASGENRLLPGHPSAKRN